MKLTFIACSTLLLMSLFRTVMPEIHNKIGKSIAKQIKHEAKESVEIVKLKMDAKVAYCEKVCGLVQVE